MASRSANLLGSVSLSVVDRVRAATAARSDSAGEGDAGLVTLGTFLNGASVEELSRALGLSHSATVRLVDRLERRGDVQRRPGHDRRSLAVVATAQGRARAKDTLEAREAALEELLEPLTERERAHLAFLHSKLLERLVELDARPANVCRLCDADGCGHYEGRCPVTEAAKAKAAL
jgi:MarR family transcriptional regulator, negative regulator of the multidrug operon emrRAB